MQHFIYHLEGEMRLIETDEEYNSLLDNKNWFSKPSDALDYKNKLSKKNKKDEKIKIIDDIKEN